MNTEAWVLAENWFLDYILRCYVMKFTNVVVRLRYTFTYIDCVDIYYLKKLHYNIAFFFYKRSYMHSTVRKWKGRKLPYIIKREIIHRRFINYEFNALYERYSQSVSALSI